MAKKVFQTNITEPSKLARISSEIARIKLMTAEGIVEEAMRIHKVSLPEKNGKTWLTKKLCYLTQELISGEALTETAKANSSSIDDPKTIESLKAFDETVAAEKEAIKAKAKATKALKAPKEAKEAKKGIEKDEFGCRIGTKRSNILLALRLGKSTYQEIIGLYSPTSKSQIQAIAKLSKNSITENSKGILNLSALA